MPVDIQRIQWSGSEPGALLYDAATFPEPTPALLEHDHYPLASPVSEGGRQAAWFVGDAAWEGVLRHYRRGGAIARISQTRYVWAGEARTRSFAEFRLLAALHDAGIAVPQPLAAGYWRRGFTYSAALLTRRIPNVRALAAQLDSAPVDAVAAALVDLHRAGVWHADLNAFNIMVDAQSKVWLLDFDRSRGGGVSKADRENNLERLARSLRKVAGARGDAVATQIHDHYLRRWRD